MRTPLLQYSEYPPAVAGTNLPAALYSWVCQKYLKDQIYFITIKYQGKEGNTYKKIIDYNTPNQALTAIFIVS